jgi:hypothetical protein
MLAKRDPVRPEEVDVLSLDFIHADNFKARRRLLAEHIFFGRTLLLASLLLGVGLVRSLSTLPSVFRFAAFIRSSAAVSFGISA